MSASANRLNRFLGRNPDELSLAERNQLAGKWLALELYSPANLALRRIAALGESAEACRGMLRERGLEPSGFQYVLMHGIH